MSLTSVLVLNQNYEPLNVCNARRAFVLVYHGKAEVLEHGAGSLRSPNTVVPLPSVIRLIYLIKRPRPQMRLSRREVFNRDRQMCQYCGRRGQRDLTLDHVMPRHRGGRHTWENLVTACKACNHRKAGRTPQEARMHLLSVPYQPRVSTYYVVYPYLDSEEGWRKFVPGWESAAEGFA
ncbi:MAG: HNH endonuclease [Chloroflexota bacterium]|nr:HNH endonuclease [Chloroflexota bacterium]